VRQQAGREFPQDVHEQLQAAIEAVWRSWNNERAFIYRRREHIPDEIGTAVNVQSMVFGNLGDDSGSGVAFTRNASTGANEIFGEYLVNAQGEDVVAGVRTPTPIADLRTQQPAIYNEFERICGVLEDHYKDMMGHRVHGRAEPAVHPAVPRRQADRAGRRADRRGHGERGAHPQGGRGRARDPNLLTQCLLPVIGPGAKYNVLARGLPAGPGAATGIAVFSADKAAEMGKGGAGERVILVRADTSPDDLKGMLAAQGVLTERGGMTSHAALVARGFGIPTVAGCSEIKVGENSFSVNGRTIREGDPISLNGTLGEVIEGTVPVEPATLTGEFGTFLGWADEFRKLGIRTNADTPKDTRLALELGAEGIGLCRTEHMFFEGERRPVVQQMILATSDAERQAALDELLVFQREDFRASSRP
jgi:pyruvate,orthophosphate dikinase